MMELKYLHVNKKQHSEALLISPNQAYMLKKLLTELIHNEVVIINTNLGLEIYYESANDCTNIIKNILAFVLSEKQDIHAGFNFLSFQNKKEIQHFLNNSIAQVVENPQFLRYMESLLTQLKFQYKANRKLIGKLSNIWNEVKQNLRYRNVNLHKMQALQDDFQDIYINTIEDKVLKELVVGAVDVKYAN